MCRWPISSLICSLSVGEEHAVLARHLVVIRATRPVVHLTFLNRHKDVHLEQREREEAQILQQPTPGRYRGGRRGGNGLLMDTASIGVTEKEDRQQGIDQQDIFDRVVLCLAALTHDLFRRVFGADDAPLGAVMGTRGDTGAAVGTATPGVGSSSASGVTTVADAATVTPKRCARAVRERAGASPRVRSAASNTGRRT
jgi:hypothetical protein